MADDISGDDNKKGVGIIGGTAALGAGAVAGAATGKLLYNKAVDGVADSVTANNNAIADAKGAVEETVGKIDATKFEGEALKAETARVQEAGAEAMKPLEETAKKLGARTDALKSVEEANFLKKGSKVAFNGPAKVKVAVLGAAVSAALLAGYLIKKFRNRGHAERIEQERAAGMQATGPSPA
jgi:hypothetical protein